MSQIINTSDYKLKITQDDRSKIDDRRKYEIKSGFSFLRQQGGLKKGLMHTILAPKHSGKSTLIRSIVTDFLRSNPAKSVFVYLSEESVIDFKSKVLLLDDDVFVDYATRVFCVSEQDEVDNFNFNTFQQMLDAFVNTESCELVIFDNITSSKFYEGKKPDAQSLFVRGFKKATALYEVATVLVAHTRKDVAHDKLFSGDDIRGSNALTIITEFMYIAQMVHIGNMKKQVLRVEKHRPCNVKNTFFFLEYSQDEMIYNKDLPVEFDQFKSVFGMRNKL